MLYYYLKILFLKIVELFVLCSGRIVLNIVLIDNLYICYVVKCLLILSLGVIF